MFFDLNTNEEIIEMYGRKFFLWEIKEDIKEKVLHIKWESDEWKKIIHEQLWKYNDDFEIERVWEKDIILFIKTIKKWLE